MSRWGRSQDADESAIEGAWASYITQLGQTHSVADRLGSSVIIGDEQQAILASVQASKVEAAALRRAVLDYVAYTDDKARKVCELESATFGSG